MAQEVWRDVVGYEGLYQVSSLGQVKRVEGFVRSKNGIRRRYDERVLSQVNCSGGHLSVALYKNNKYARFNVHMLVAEAFIPCSDATLVLQHINGDKHDNRVENLHYVSLDEIAMFDKYDSGNIQNEQWLPAVGYEGYYEVSNMGRVRSVSRVVTCKNNYKRIVHGKVLCSKIRNGYQHVTICINNIKITCSIHRLVAEAFLEPVEGKEYVDHINGIKTDNRAENLRWVTPSENNQYAIDLGLVDRKSLSKRAKEAIKRRGTATPPKPVIRDDGAWFESGAAAARAIGAHQSEVSAVARGVRKHVRGHTFRFAEHAQLIAG